MKFFTESWHSRLATFYGPMDRGYRDRKVDFCKYFWAAVQGGFAVGAILMAATLLSFPVGSTISWILFMVINHTWVPPAIEAMILMGGVVAVALAFLMMWLTDNVYKPVKAKLQKRVAGVDIIETKFSFLATWMYSFKNKVCVPITLKGKSNDD